MASKEVRMLLEAIVDYLQWLRAEQEPRASRASKGHGEVLSDFVIFSIDNDIAWRDMFCFETFREFRNYTDLKNTSHALIGLSSYLYERGSILKPLEMPNYQVQLPAIYEQYLLYLQQSKAPSKSNLGAVRRVLVPFHEYLKDHNIELASLKI